MFDFGCCLWDCFVGGIFFFYCVVFVFSLGDVIFKGMNVNLFLFVGELLVLFCIDCGCVMWVFNFSLVFVLVLVVVFIV